MYTDLKEGTGLVREWNPGPLAPEARIIPTDQPAAGAKGKTEVKFHRNPYFTAANTTSRPSITIMLSEY